MIKLLIHFLMFVATTAAMQPFHKDSDYLSSFTYSDIPQAPRAGRVTALRKTSAAKGYTHAIDSTVSLSSNDKSIHYYNDQGLCTTRLECEWDSITGTWKNTEKKVFSYDLEGNRIADTSFNWIATSGFWQFSGRREMGYDNFQNITTEHTYWYIEATKQWDIYSNNDYHFDSLGLSCNIIRRQINTAFSDPGYSSWDSSKVEVITDTFGNHLSQINYTHDSSGTWIPKFKDTSSYDEHGTRVLEIEYTWDNSSLAWIETIEKQKETNEYNESGLCISRVYYYWNSAQEDWNLIDKWEREYNDNGVCIADSVLSKSNNTFTVTFKKLYTYSDIPLDNVLMDDDLRDYHKDINATCFVSKSTSYDRVKDSLKLSSTFTLFYSRLPEAPVLSQSPFTQQLEFTITRTPTAISITPLTKDFQTIVTICDLHGRTVERSATGTRHSLKTAHYPAGVYLLSVSGKTGKRIRALSFVK